MLSLHTISGASISAQPASAGSKVSADAAIAYAVRAAVTANFPITYGVLAAGAISHVSADLNISYSTRSYVSKDMTCAYSVNGSGSSANDQLAIIAAGISSSRTINFDGGTSRVNFGGGTNRVDFL